MKKGIAVMMSILLLTMSGCGRTAAASSVEQIKIGISLYSSEDTFIGYLRDGLEESAKAQETQDQVKITLNIRDGKSNQMIQNEQVDKFIAQDYHVICVNLADRTNAAVIIDKAKAADIPVIFFNREPVAQDIKRWDKVYYVGSDAVQSGTMQGDLVADLYREDEASVDRNRDGKLQYIVLEGEPGHQDAALRTEHSVKTVMRRGIRMERLAADTANWQRGQAYSKMSGWLEQPEILSGAEVIFCNNDDMALGVIDAYQDKHIGILPVIVGVDGTPLALQAMKEGTLAGTVRNDSDKQADAIFHLAYALAQDRPIPADKVPLTGQYVWIPHTPVDLASLKE